MTAPLRVVVKKEWERVEGGRPFVVETLDCGHKLARDNWDVEATRRRCHICVMRQFRAPEEESK